MGSPLTQTNRRGSPCRWKSPQSRATPHKTRTFPAFIWGQECHDVKTKPYVPSFIPLSKGTFLRFLLLTIRGDAGDLLTSLPSPLSVLKQKNRPIDITPTQTVLSNHHSYPSPSHPPSPQQNNQRPQPSPYPPESKSAQPGSIPQKPFIIRRFHGFSQILEPASQGIELKTSAN